MVPLLPITDRDTASRYNLGTKAQAGKTSIWPKAPSQGSLNR